MFALDRVNTWPNLARGLTLTLAIRNELSTCDEARSHAQGCCAPDCTEPAGTDAIRCRETVKESSLGRLTSMLAIEIAMRARPVRPRLSFAVYSPLVGLTSVDFRPQQNIPCRCGKSRATLAAFACYAQLVVALVPFCQFAAGDLGLRHFELFGRSMSWIHSVPAPQPALTSPSMADKSLSIDDDRASDRH